jgi:hypothetical protein
MRVFGDKPCACGSGLPRYDLTDARGIFCGFVCTKCEPARRKRYRPEIFTNAQYEADEPIESD